MYAIVRTDLSMTRGKAASQAGHAFLDSYLNAPPDIIRAYLADGGTKIVLAVDSEKELCAIYHRCRTEHLPCAMVIESNHIHPPDFDGSPIPTAVGIGPTHRAMVKQITKGLKLMA
jgi:PTH2 family peptidyl-tRNA hydrolase